jgi:hypothetical protein
LKIAADAGFAIAELYYHTRLDELTNEVPQIHHHQLFAVMS